MPAAADSMATNADFASVGFPVDYHKRDCTQKIDGNESSEIAFYAEGRSR